MSDIGDTDLVARDHVPIVERSQDGTKVAANSLAHSSGVKLTSVSRLPGSPKAFAPGTTL